ncbi:MAG: FtsW/RodA/SpoVE family cell cycle protein [Firmicutes bacterium]|nr:FtsW/RodA/SpoVE family cell cycle protein [Bacillota bacterium]
MTRKVRGIMEFLENAIEIAKIYFTTGVRWVFMILALYILLRQIRSLALARNPSEIWAYLGCPDGTSVPLTHWENLLGRGRGCDVVINLGSVSRSHGTLIRDSEGIWKYEDLLSKNGSAINGEIVQGPTEVGAGDILTIGGSDFTLYPVSLQERMANIEKRKRRTKNISPWPSLVALTIYQFLTIVQFKVSLGEDFPSGLIPSFGLLAAAMWVYFILMRRFKRVGFEMETIAFFLSTMSLAVTTSAYPSTVFKQAFCIVIGLGLFFILCWMLRDLNRVKRIVHVLMAASVVLLFINITMGSLKNGSTNWVSIGGFTFQPSELIKIVFIFVGAATLDELQKRKNMLTFIIFSVFCLGCLAKMGDFGTAMIFFVTFLVISFLRSGDFSRLFLILGVAGAMGMMVLRFKPYIAGRFSIWRHVWDDPTDKGFQQVQAMCSAASGGLPGLGAGNGTLSDVAAAPTDLVFGLVCEEWGLVIAILMTLCIVTLGVFAVRSIIAGRSTYYSIAACGAMSMFIFQTILNVFGTVDLLPLTGVTFPFLSAGGTSMIASWGMLAFLKAADTRQNASFAVKLDKKGDFDNEMEAAGPTEPEDILDSIGVGGGAASAAARRAAAANEARQRSQAPAPNQYSYDDKKATIYSSSKSDKGKHFTNRRSKEYRNQSDEEFFRNFGDARPGDGFEERYEKVAPQPEKASAPAKRAGTKVSTGRRASDAAKVAGSKAAGERRSTDSAKSVHQSGAERKTPVPNHKPKGKSQSQKLTQEERIRRQRQVEESRKRAEKAKAQEEKPLTLEDIFGDDHR